MRGNRHTISIQLDASLPGPSPQIEALLRRACKSYGVYFQAYHVHGCWLDLSIYVQPSQPWPFKMQKMLRRSILEALSSDLSATRKQVA